MSLSELGRCPFCGSLEIVVDGVFICPNCANENAIGDELDQMETIE